MRRAWVLGLLALSACGGKPESDAPEGEGENAVQAEVKALEKKADEAVNSTLKTIEQEALAEQPAPTAPVSPPINENAKAASPQ
jgi:hypothetical protein